MTSKEDRKALFKTKFNKCALQGAKDARGFMVKILF